MYKLKKLNPLVVEEAIQRISSDKDHFTCHALRDAACGYHRKGIGVSNQYIIAYRDFHLGPYCQGWIFPRWWNASAPYKASRIKALKDFKAFLEANDGVV